MRYCLKEALIKRLSANQRRIIRRIIKGDYYEQIGWKSTGRAASRHH
ncbi:MAG: hypothetical protein MJ077_08945 [Oscillospiraceae bacterium]|nr:hypothetical protein [Oscillospiraceae bacterium]